MLELLPYIAAGGVAIGAVSTGFAFINFRDARAGREIRRCQEAEKQAAAEKRRLGVEFKYELDQALATLDQLNEISRLVTTKDELLTEDLKAQRGFAPLTMRIGNLGARLPEPVGSLLNGGEDAVGVRHQAQRLLDARLIDDGVADRAEASLREVGLRAIVQYESAIQLQAAITAASSAIRGMLPD